MHKLAASTLVLAKSGHLGTSTKHRLEIHPDYALLELSGFNAMLLPKVLN
jgi:hypothetical protein